jgi:hypothetical protein
MAFGDLSVCLVHRELGTEVAASSAARKPMKVTVISKLDEFPTYAAALRRRRWCGWAFGDGAGERLGDLSINPLRREFGPVYERFHRFPPPRRGPRGAPSSGETAKKTGARKLSKCEIELPRARGYFVALSALQHDVRSMSSRSTMKLDFDPVSLGGPGSKVKKRKARTSESVAFARRFSQLQNEFMPRSRCECVKGTVLEWRAYGGLGMKSNDVAQKLIDVADDWLAGATLSTASDEQIATLIDGFQLRAGRELDLLELEALFELRHYSEMILKGRLRVVGRGEEGELQYALVPQR